MSPDPVLEMIPQHVAAQVRSASGGGSTTTDTSTTTTTDTTNTDVPGLHLTPEELAIIQAGRDSKTKTEDPDITRGRQAYVDIWGIDPPKGYIESLVSQGMNPYEIRAHELSKLGPDGKPLAMRANYWRDQEATYASVASQVFARR